MLVTGPSPAVFGPSTAAIQVMSVMFDLTAHTYLVIYQPQGAGINLAQQKTVSGAIPAALQTALETHAQNVIEAKEGWAANSSTVTAP